MNSNFYLKPTLLSGLPIEPDDPISGSYSEGNGDSTGNRGRNELGVETQEGSQGGV